jgi:hypothetical protein
VINSGYDWLTIDGMIKGMMINLGKL